jgi:hypothetical protein
MIRSWLNASAYTEEMQKLWRFPYPQEISLYILWYYRTLRWSAEGGKKFTIHVGAQKLQEYLLTEYRASPMLLRSPHIWVSPLDITLDHLTRRDICSIDPDE